MHNGCGFGCIRASDKRYHLRLASFLVPVAFFAAASILAAGEAPQAGIAGFERYYGIYYNGLKVGHMIEKLTSTKSDDWRPQAVPASGGAGRAVRGLPRALLARVGTQGFEAG